MNNQISGILALVLLWTALVKTDGAEGAPLSCGSGPGLPPPVAKGLLPATLPEMGDMLKPNTRYSPF